MTMLQVRWTVIARKRNSPGSLNTTEYSVAFDGVHVPGCPWWSRLTDAQATLADLRRAELIKV